VPVRYKGVVLEKAFQIDLLVENRLVIELKSTERDSALYPKQLLTHLRLMDLPLGLLMNFGQETFKQGVQRVANNHNPL
jgi:GxxExxY protein